MGLLLVVPPWCSVFGSGDCAANLYHVTRRRGPGTQGGHCMQTPCAALSRKHICSFNLYMRMSRVPKFLEDRTREKPFPQHRDPEPSPDSMSRKLSMEVTLGLHSRFQCHMPTCTREGASTGTLPQRRAFLWLGPRGTEGHRETWGAHLLQDQELPGVCTSAGLWGRRAERQDCTEVQRGQSELGSRRPLQASSTAGSREPSTLGLPRHSASFLRTE